MSDAGEKSNATKQLQRETETAAYESDVNAQTVELNALNTSVRILDEDK